MRRLECMQNLAGKLKDALQSSFGGVKEFKDAFQKAAVAPGMTLPHALPPVNSATGTARQRG